MESITSEFSMYIHQFLQPLAQSVPSYTRDSIHFMDMLQKYIWELTYKWVSLDVYSLYMSIQHDVGI